MLLGRRFRFLGLSLRARAARRSSRGGILEALRAAVVFVAVLEGQVSACVAMVLVDVQA